jgi:hypothetical protein
MLVCTLILPVALQSVLHARTAFAFTPNDEKSSGSALIAGLVNGLVMLGVALKDQSAHNNKQLALALNRIKTSPGLVSQDAVSLLRWLHEKAPLALSALVTIAKNARCHHVNEKVRQHCNEKLQNDIAKFLGNWFPKKAFRPECLDPETRKLPKCANDRIVFGVFVPKSTQKPQTSYRTSNSLRTPSKLSDFDPKCEQEQMLLNSFKHIVSMHQLDDLMEAVSMNNIERILRKNESMLLWMVDHVFNHMLASLTKKARENFLRAWDSWKKENLYDNQKDYDKAIDQWLYYYGSAVFQRYFNSLSGKNVDLILSLGNLMEYLSDTTDIIFALNKQRNDGTISENESKLITLSRTIPTIQTHIDNDACAKAMELITEIITKSHALGAYHELASKYARLTSPPEEIAKLYHTFPKQKRTLKESIARVNKTSALLNQKFSKVRRPVRTLK